MTEWLIWLSWPLLLAGMFFFISGTLGVLRFPDVYSRLHAVTKADTLGLGLLATGLALRSDGWQPALLMLLIWVLVMVSSATACQLLARHQRELDSDDGADTSASQKPEEQHDQR